MSKLVKIKDVNLYVGFTEDAADCYEALKLLRTADIKFGFLNYSDQETHHKSNFDALSTWVLGRDGHQKKVEKYPILVWDECFEDWTICRRIAHGLQEIKESDVLKYPELLNSK